MGGLLVGNTIVIGDKNFGRGNYTKIRFATGLQC